MKARTFLGGIRLHGKSSDGKYLTDKSMIVPFSPKQVVLPMKQNIGSVNDPCVVVGQKVAIGECIATASGYVGSTIHASVSGTVTAIEPRAHICGQDILSVVIENDFQNTFLGEIKPRENVDDLTEKEMVDIIACSGVVGMGGATFPTHVKLSPDHGEKIDIVLINASECEPYLTCDHRLMIERTDDIISGAQLIRKIVHANQIIIGIEENKPDAIAKLQKACHNHTGMSVQVLKAKYPQGGEKMLIKAATGRTVPMGKLPSAVGCIVCNVGTAIAIDEAIRNAMPLVARVCTVTGDVEKPQNLQAPIGTLVQDLIDFCGGFRGAPAKIVVGGPMMGTAICNTSVPITKGSNGILVFNENRAVFPLESNCIRCGKCVDVCPVQLIPLEINAAYLNDHLDICRDLNATNCMACGACSFVCPAKRFLSQTIDLAKQAIIKMEKEENNVNSRSK